MSSDSQNFEYKKLERDAKNTNGNKRKNIIASYFWTLSLGLSNHGQLCAEFNYLAPSNCGIGEVPTYWHHQIKMVVYCVLFKTHVKKSPQSVFPSHHFYLQIDFNLLCLVLQNSYLHSYFNERMIHLPNYRQFL